MEKRTPPADIAKMIVDDTGWEVASRSGLAVDYQRVVKFNRELTDEEMIAIVSWVRVDLFWGWAAMPQVEARRDPSKTAAWKFEATVDSS